MSRPEAWRRAKGWIAAKTQRAWRRARPYLGVSDTTWTRVVMDEETAKLVRAMPCRDLDVLEISGIKWRDFGFRNYRSVEFPAYDVCTRPLATESFDLVIAEQVLEHVPRPLRALTHIRQMLKEDGSALITTPFLLRVHEAPIDCSRWTELGLRYLLIDAGFDSARMSTGSWGNRDCVVGNFRAWVPWVKWLHSLRNEPEFPVVVWALARNPRLESAS